MIFEIVSPIQFKFKKNSELFDPPIEMSIHIGGAVHPVHLTLHDLDQIKCFFENCHSLLKDNIEVYKCIDCGKKMVEYEAHWYGNADYPYCFKCWEKLPGLDEGEE